MADYADPVPLCLMCVHLNIAVGQLPSMEIAGRTDKVQMTMSKVEHRAWGKSREAARHGHDRHSLALAR